MKYIFLATIIFAFVFAAEDQNISHELKILKEEIKEIKHYLHEFKNELRGIIDTQKEEINKLTHQIVNQGQKISEMNIKIELLNEGSLFQEERIKSLSNQILELKNNSKIYVQKLDLLNFFKSLDPNRATDLWYLGSNYGGWLRDHDL